MPDNKGHGIRLFAAGTMWKAIKYRLDSLPSAFLPDLYRKWLKKEEGQGMKKKFLYSLDKFLMNIKGSKIKREKQ